MLEGEGGGVRGYVRGVSEGEGKSEGVRECVSEGRCRVLINTTAQHHYAPQPGGQGKGYMRLQRPLRQPLGTRFQRPHSRRTGFDGFCNWDESVSRRK